MLYHRVRPMLGCCETNGFVEGSHLVEELRGCRIDQREGGRLNATIEKRSSAHRIWVGESYLLFEGVLGQLDWHQHSFACVLVSLSGCFEVAWGEESAQGELLLAPPALEHRLVCGDAWMITIYIPPHERDFCCLRQAAAERASFVVKDAAWEKALVAWEASRDPQGLKEAIRQTWGRMETRALDVRIMRIMQAFWRGERLQEEVEALAQWVGLSASRLRSLCKQETGSSLRQIRRGYRFWHAARAMVLGANFTEAAHTAEFADSSHFSRAFRDSYGLSPTQILPAQTTWHLCAGL